MNSIKSGVIILRVPNPTVSQLRQKLREQFPAAHRSLPLEHPGTTQSRIPRFPDGLPQGGITEITPTNPACAPGLLVASLLAHEPSATPIPELALIDGRDQFDPCSFPPGDCAKLLWIRCQSPTESLKATDCLLRDGNLPRIILDLLGFPQRELSGISASIWHRFKQSIETNNQTFITLTPRPLIPCATLRLSLHSRFTLADFEHPREQLLDRLQATPLSQQRHHG